MDRIWPAKQAGPVDHDQLERLYGYPDSNWLVVNFVSSLDGAVELNGRAVELSNQADQHVLRLGSDLADALLVGATTATVEKFRGQHPDEQTAQRRSRAGLSPVAPTVVVSTGRSLPADAPVITEALVPTIVLTSQRASQEARDGWSNAGAIVLTCGEDEVDLARGIELLAQRGLRRIDCEGGPSLFGALLGAGLVDELRLTLSPVLVAGTASRIATGPVAIPATFTLSSALAEDDTLLLRYLRGH